MAVRLRRGAEDVAQNREINVARFIDLLDRALGGEQDRRMSLCASKSIDDGALTQAMGDRWAAGCLKLASLDPDESGGS